MYFGHFKGLGVFSSGNFLGFGGIFGHFLVLGGILAIFRFWRHFCHFIGFRSISIIIKVLGYFAILQICGVFWSFLGFRGIFVIFQDLGVFWSFFSFREFLVIFQVRGYFGHFLGLGGYFGYFLVRFQRYFGNVLGFRSISVIFYVLRVF